jgi:hypothetical protein
MKNILIKKGMRRTFPYFGIPSLIYINGNKDYSKSKSFMFTDSSIYDLHDEDQHDVNKLYGFSMWYHKKNSVRFGWRPSKDMKKMEIVAYEYFSGVRIPTTVICEVKLNEFYDYKINYDAKKAVLTYTVINRFGREIGKYAHTKKIKKFVLGYSLTTYFGGNELAPHDILIHEK